MSRNSDYKNLKALVNSLSLGVDKLEAGNLNHKELANLLDDARSLHERIIVLQYLAFEKDVKQKEVKKPKKEKDKGQGSFELNFGTPEPEVKEEVKEVEKTEPIEEDEVHPNQINLLDAIEEHGDEGNDTSEERNEEETKVEEGSVKSINEKFAEESSEKTLAHKLSRQPIEDLKGAIGLNQKFLFMNDLFQGENELFNEAVEAINNFENLEQAMDFVNNKLSSSYDWDKASQSVVNFIDLVERRFMA